MFRPSIFFLIVVLLALVAPGLFGQETQQEKVLPGKERIEQLIRNLASEDFRVREKATEELENIGAPAEQTLKEALKSDDPEVRWRAQTILRKIETPQQVTERAPAEKEQPDQSPGLRKGPAPETETPSLRGPEDILKRLERFRERSEPQSLEDILKQIDRFLKEVEESRKQMLRELPGFSEESKCAREELEEWLKQQNIAPEKEIEELLRRLESQRTPHTEQEREGAQGKAIFRYRVWKDGKLVTDETREEFFGASIFGLTLSSVSDTLRYHLGIAEGEGVLVESIARTSPFFGKLEKYDIILNADQSSVNSPESLQKLLSNKEKTTLTIIRKGKPQQVEVNLTSDGTKENGNR